MKKFKSEPVKTILTISVGLLVIFLITGNIWLARVSAVIGLVGIFSNYLSAKLEFAWFKLAGILGQIVPNILLSAIYLLVIFPVALLRRLFTKSDLLVLKNPDTRSIYTENKRDFDKLSFEKIW